MLDPRHLRTGYVEKRGGRPEEHHSSLSPHHLGQARLCTGVAELGEASRLLRLPALPQSLPPLPQLVLQLLLLVIPGHQGQCHPPSPPPQHLLLEVADDDRQWQGHGEGSTDCCESSYKFPEARDREDVAVSHGGHGDDHPVEGGWDVGEPRVVFL